MRVVSIAAEGALRHRVFQALTSIH